MASHSQARTVVVSAVHRPRTLQRIITIVGGRGYDVEDVRYVRSSGDRALARIVVDPDLASRGLDHLCALLARVPDVLWARPMEAGETPERGPGRFGIVRYDVSTRGGGGGGATTEAVIAASVDGRRELAAGGGGDAAAALVEAFGALLERLAPSAGLSLEVMDRWCTYEPSGPAFAAARASEGERRWEHLCSAGDDVAALVAALADVTAAALDDVGRRTPTPAHDRVVATV